MPYLAFASKLFWLHLIVTPSIGIGNKHRKKCKQSLFILTFRLDEFFFYKIWAILHFFVFWTRRLFETIPDFNHRDWPKLSHWIQYTFIKILKIWMFLYLMDSKVCMYIFESIRYIIHRQISDSNYYLLCNNKDNFKS